MKKTEKKSGFTLVELMVVAAIIAILAAIIIPLLSSNKDRAIAAEASNICGTVLTEAKVLYAALGTWPSQAQLEAGQIDDEINKGRYFDWSCVSFAAGKVTVSGDGTAGSADNGFTDGASYDLSLDETAGYTGTMVDNNLVVN